MTRRTNASMAGITFLLYIAIGMFQMAALGGTTKGDTAAQKLATMAERASIVHANAVLTLLTCIVALALGVALYALTRDEDGDLALLGLACRVAEAVTGAIFIPISLGLLAIATPAGASAVDPAAADPVLAVILAGRRWNPTIAATFFAVGSTLFSWLLARGRIVPAVLGWLGVVSSVLLVVALPLELAGILPRGSMIVWMPMLVFEVVLALWFLVKGAAPPARARVGQAPAPRPR